MDKLKIILENLYQYLYRNPIVPTPVVETPKLVIKSNREKLLDIAIANYGIDPTPKDEQPDEFACVHSLTTIVKQLLPDFKVIVYTPDLVIQLQNDNRFKEVLEFKPGNIIISATSTGNGTIVGHTGIISNNGKVLSNSSATGLWFDKFDLMSWIERYSRRGQLALYVFELQ